ncbi:putative membrane protein YeaQ/YmgE (transglycosylase-associated protein family) [Sporosarcina luteola]|nr:putative membrane protein YeaQ/YmgE (transglycosylase-associated protein family) [Sporosarcina luteola]
MNKQREGKRGTFVEILGDTISERQLIISIALSVLISLGGYKLGQAIFPSFAEERMVNSYSLLLGIAGTVTVLVLNSLLFKPKRILVEDEISATNMAEVFADLQLDIEEELKLIEEDPITKRELQELGVLSNLTGNKKEGKQ